MSTLDEQLAGIWLELLPGDEITPATDFFERGGNSITAVHLAALVQERLGIAVDAIEVVMLRTFEALADAIGQRLADSPTA